MGRSRNAAELINLARALHGAGIQLELLIGPMTGTYDPAGMGSMLCAVCAVAAQLDRDHIRALREAGTPMPKIGRTVTINTGTPRRCSRPWSSTARTAHPAPSTG